MPSALKLRLEESLELEVRLVIGNGEIPFAKHKPPLAPPKEGDAYLTHPALRAPL